jgi:hypothetical protein
LGVLALAACGNNDDVTTVKDLRVLAVKAEPAGFLVPIDDPSPLAGATAIVTALVVDPLQPSQVLHMTSEGCPDYIDTITGASGQGSKLCPAKSVTDAFPPPFDSDLATTPLPESVAGTAMGSPIQYEPGVAYGLGNNDMGQPKLTDFFVPSATSMMFPPLNDAVLLNRDYGFDALVNLSFTLGDESAAAIKRVVYWPLLPDALVEPMNAAVIHDLKRDNTATQCPSSQMPNKNPVLTRIDFFHQRMDGIPQDAVPDMEVPTLSIATDQLYVQPAFDGTTAEHYYLRVKNGETGLIETHCHQEQLTFQFFTTAGTFSPAERTSELPLALNVPANGHIPIDSQWKPPKADAIPSDGKVSIWIVTRDERAGASWMRRDFQITP